MQGALEPLPNVTTEASIAFQTEPQTKVERPFAATGEDGELWQSQNVALEEVCVFMYNIQIYIYIYIYI